MEKYDFSFLLEFVRSPFFGHILLVSYSMKPIFRMPPKTFLQRGLYSIALNMLISSGIFHLTLKTDWHAWSLTPTALSALNLLCQTWQACSHAQCLRKDYISECAQIDLEMRVLNPIQEQMAWLYGCHQSTSAVGPGVKNVRSLRLSLTTGLSSKWLHYSRRVTSYPGLCNKQAPSPYHALKRIIQRWERLKFNL